MWIESGIGPKRHSFGSWFLQLGSSLFNGKGKFDLKVHIGSRRFSHRNMRDDDQWELAFPNLMGSESNTYLPHTMDRKHLRYEKNRSTVVVQS